MSGSDSAAVTLRDFHGQSAIALRAPDGASAIVLLHGAQVLSWCPAGGKEQLYLSERANFGAGAAVRGGMPVIFPQFSDRGPLPRHGFARTRPWRPLRAETGTDDALAVFELTSDTDTRALWPHEFVLELTVCVGANRLDVELAVANRGTTAFAFTAALHSYLRVHEVETARLTGLLDRRYQDCLTGVTRTEAMEAVLVDAALDRVYFNVKAPLQLSEKGRDLRIEAEHFPEVVVWNPWQEKIATMADLPPTDFRRFLCVEAALIERPAELAPGAEWWGRQSLIAK